jgi:hypothetical protein
LIPLPYAAEGKQSYPDFWAITGGLQYLVYKTLIRLLWRVTEKATMTGEGSLKRLL